MTTVATVIEQTRRHLYAETRDELNKLSAGTDADDTALTFNYAVNGIQEGARLAIDLEELHVWSSSGTNAVVQRGVNGSTAATHASGALVYVNPRFTPFGILQALNDELRSLSSPGKLYRVATAVLTYESGTTGYDLTGVTDLLEPLDVAYDANDGTDAWPRLDRGLWRLARNLSTSDFPSGMALIVNGYAEPGRPLRVTYTAPFTANLATLADNVETASGLPATAIDILPLGAAIRLTMGNEVARNSLDQGETRRAGEVPAGARAGAMRGLLALYQQRVSEEVARLYSQNPVVR